MCNKLLFSSLAFSLIFILGANSDNIRHYDGYSVFRLIPKTGSQLKFLYNLAENNNGIDFWKFPSDIGRFVDVMVPPHLNRTFEKILRKKNISKKIIVEDVEKLLDEERIAQKRADVRDRWDAYQPLSEILSWLDTTQSANPSITQTEVIGKSYGNNDLKLIKIGEGVANKNKPIIFFDSAIHAREWITPAFTTALIQKLIDGYNNNDPEIRPLVQKFDWYILPVLNPDGYAYTFSNERLWRKTRKPNTGSTCIGTDANRNFNYQWGTVGASTNPCSETFRGPEAFSEPEAKQLSEYITLLGNQVKAYFAIHSYGQYLLYPWGYTSALPPDSPDLDRLGSILITALAGPYGTKYSLGSSTNVLYSASGNAVDWACGAGKVKYAYTIELRPQNVAGSPGFVLPPEQIKPTSEETILGIVAFAKQLALEV